MPAERHPNGEVFTLDQMERRTATTSSTILYLDGKERVFQGFGCLGTQSSRRLDSETVEILRTCGREQTRVRPEMVLEAKRNVLGNNGAAA